MEEHRQSAHPASRSVVVPAPARPHRAAHPPLPAPTRCSTVTQARPASPAEHRSSTVSVQQWFGQWISEQTDTGSSPSSAIDEPCVLGQVTAPKPQVSHVLNHGALGIRKYLAWG